MGALDAVDCMHKPQLGVPPPYSALVRNEAWESRAQPYGSRTPGAFAAGLEEKHPLEMQREGGLSTSPSNFKEHDQTLSPTAP